MLLLGEPVYLSLYIVIASLLTGVLCGYAWGYYLAPPVLAVVFSLPGPAGTDTLQFLATLISAVWIARRIPEKHLKHFAHLVPGTQASQRQAKGHDEHLKQVLGEKKSINTSPFLKNWKPRSWAWKNRCCSIRCRAWPNYWKE